jgi:invasion protein IalB
MSHRHGLLLCSILLAAGFAIPAHAEDQKPAETKPAEKPAAHSHERARPSRPRIESKGYGAWALRCAEIEPSKTDKDSPKPIRHCEISEIISAANHAGTLAKVTVGHLGEKGELTALVLLPANVSFPSSVHIRTDAKDIWGVELDWARCVPGACLAQAGLGDATVEHWRGLKTTGSIVFRDSSGQEIHLPMSFDGFGDALDALNKIDAAN